MNRLSGIQRIEVQQVDIDNAEGKKRCPIFQSLKREFGIETKPNRDCITSLFDRACFGAADYIFGQFGYIGVSQEMRNFMSTWDKTQTAVPTAFEVNTHECRESDRGHEIIMDFYERHAGFRQRQEIESYLGL